jgi:hypothetical protein
LRIGKLLGILLLLSGLLPTIALAGTSGPSPIPPPPAFQITTPILTLCRGVVNNVPETISNPGSQPMTSMQLGLISSKNIYAIGNGTVNQATVPANGTTVLTLPIFVSLNTSSLVSLGISVNYNYFSLYSDSEVRNVSFGVETCPSPLLIETNSTVTSGRIENMTLKLTNIGSTKLSAVSLKMSMPSQDAAILTNQPIQIGTIAPGASTKVTEKVFMFRNASQTFPLNVSIQMYNGTSPVQLLDTMPLLSSGIINITPSSITLSPANPTAGSIFSISLILTDIGTAGASAVTATLLPPSGITPYGSNYVFIGDMSVDTQTPVTMTMQANVSLKSGSYTIPVRINYLNNLRENISTTIRVPVTIGAGLASNFTRTGASGSRYGGATGFMMLPMILVIVIIIAIALAFLYMRERKRARKAK